MKRALCVQHVPFEQARTIGTSLAVRGFAIDTLHPYAGDRFPTVEEIDFLVVLGGPMSVHDVEKLPWLTEEKNFIRAFLGTGRPTLGVCLGAQLLAEALGGQVRCNSQPEIGWFPVHGTATRLNAFAFPDRFEALHWHGETFSLPPGARHLARSPACENQAFAFGSNVLGLQFHLEMNPEGVRAICDACPGDLVPGTWVQSDAQVLGVDTEVFATSTMLLGLLLDDLLEPSTSPWGLSG